ncbi:hypothetical protein LQZ18_14615 [Lachnospiraceae bacterium ZAX-1]
MDGHGMNGHGMNGHGMDGNSMNGHGMNGHGMNGHSISENRMNGHSISENRMHEHCIDIEVIVKKSRELRISFPNLLSGYIVEYVLEMILQYEWKEELWLKNVNCIGVECYRKKVRNHLIFYQSQNKEDTRNIFEEIFKLDARRPFSIQWNIDVIDSRKEINITVLWDKILVPLLVSIYAIEGLGLFAREQSLESCIIAGKCITYLEYPIELHLVENFYEMIEKLELISSYEIFDDTYHILISETIEGRKIHTIFQQFIENKKLPSWEKRWETVVEYKNYGYMKKKWNSYFKKSKKEYVAWEKVISLLDVFFTPIWNAIKEDIIFFGDWMPNLRRFLD